MQCRWDPSLITFQSRVVTSLVFFPSASGAAPALGLLSCERTKQFRAVDFRGLLNALLRLSGTWWARFRLLLSWEKIARNFRISLWPAPLSYVRVIRARNYPSKPTGTFSRRCTKQMAMVSPAGRRISSCVVVGAFARWRSGFGVFYYKRKALACPVSHVPNPSGWVARSSKQRTNIKFESAFMDMEEERNVFGR